MTSNKLRGHALVAVAVILTSLVAATMTWAPMNVIASTEEEGKDKDNGEKKGLDKSNNGNNGNGNNKKNDEDDSDSAASSRGDNDGDNNGDDNVAFTSQTESTINGEQKEDRDVRSNENSKNAAVEITHELTHTVQSGGAEREPAHKGKITFADEDGEVVKEIKITSAPQSSGAGSKIDFDGKLSIREDFKFD